MNPVTPSFAAAFARHVRERLIDRAPRQTGTADDLGNDIKKDGDEEGGEARLASSRPERV
jgi:hypothetical protein